MGLTPIPPSQAALSATYALKSETDPDEIFIPATLFDASLGTPTRGTLNGGRLSGYTLPNHATTQQQVVSPTIQLPSSWTTFAIDFFWSNLAAGSGNAVFVVVAQRIAVGGSLATGTVTGSANLAQAAAASDVLNKVSNALNNVSNVPTEVFGFRVRREPDSAGDTLANSVGFYGLILRKVT